MRGTLGDDEAGSVGRVLILRHLQITLGNLDPSAGAQGHWRVVGKSIT